MQEEIGITMQKKLIILFWTTSLIAQSGLTYEVTGRLGDNLLTYCKHKWIAHVHKLNLYVPHFKYADAFEILDTELTARNIPRHLRNVRLNNQSQLTRQNSNYLYHSSYYTQIENLELDECADFVFKKSIEDPKFGQDVREALSLKNAHKTEIKIPLDKITVAIHIRKGCGIDYPLISKQYINDPQIPRIDPEIYSDEHHSLKFPPEQFYAEQLEKLYYLLDKQPLYGFIFTDDAHPFAIAQKLTAYLEKKGIKIILDTNEANTTAQSSIMADIYAMTKFDYLIRSESHFPWISQMIGSHKGIIRPVACEWEDGYLKMTKVLMDIPDRSRNMLKTIEI